MHTFLVLPSSLWTFDKSLSDEVHTYVPCKHSNNSLRVGNRQVWEIEKHRKSKWTTCSKFTTMLFQSYRAHWKWKGARETGGLPETSLRMKNQHLSENAYRSIIIALTKMLGATHISWATVGLIFFQYRRRIWKISRWKFKVAHGQH